LTELRTALFKFLKCVKVCELGLLAEQPCIVFMVIVVEYEI